MRAFILIFLLFAGFESQAEYRSYGSVQLRGLARESGSLQPPGLTDVMICNVNGLEGLLAIRTGPDATFPVVRKLERLAILRVDTQVREGDWLYVIQAYRTHSPNGLVLSQSYGLGVSGWVQEDFLCDFRFLSNSLTPLLFENNKF